MFSADAVGTNVCLGAATTGGFLICGSSDSVVDPQEVSLLRELGNEVVCLVPLSGSSYHV
jgi:hypothetical protein